jgi:hypothetical protein
MTSWSTCVLKAITFLYHLFSHLVPWKRELPPIDDDATALDLSDLPRFTYNADIVESLGRVTPDLGLLIFGSVPFFSMTFAASFASFLRYDVLYEENSKHEYRNTRQIQMVKM